MSGSFDLAGDLLTLRIRRGSDQTIDFFCRNADGSDFDLSNQAAHARIVDGDVEHPLPSRIAGSVISVDIFRDVTEVISTYTRFALSMVDGDAHVTPLVFGEVTCIQELSAP